MLPLGVCTQLSGYLANSGGREYLSTFSAKALFLGKEPEFLAECNQEDHCPINKVSSLPATPKGMFNGTMCPTSRGTIQSGDCS